jgi:hypothetical protein
MKRLIAAIAIVLVLGTLAFLYRYEIEKLKLVGGSAFSGAGVNGVACTEEAKICPDGSAVGRTGPNCSFAACPPPNAELTSASTTIDFVLPPGYSRNIVPSDDSSYLASYIQSTAASNTFATDTASTIDVHAYQIPAGQTASQVMLAQTYFDPSGMTATSTTAFKTITEGKNTFYEILIGRFEGQVQSAYYLYEPNEVLRFDVTEHGVQSWSDPSLVPNTLPQHIALQQMLATLEVSQ